MNLSANIERCKRNNLWGKKESTDQHLQYLPICMLKIKQIEGKIKRLIHTSVCIENIVGLEVNSGCLWEKGKQI